MRRSEWRSALPNHPQVPPCHPHKATYLSLNLAQCPWRDLCLSEHWQEEHEAMNLAVFPGDLISAIESSCTTASGLGPRLLFNHSGLGTLHLLQHHKQI